MNEKRARLEHVCRQRWCELVPEFLDRNHEQTWAYARALAWRKRALCEHVAVLRGDDVLGLAAIRIRSVPWLRTGVALVAGGPLTRRGCADDLERLGACLEQLRLEYADRRGHVLRVIAPLGSPAWNINAVEAFERAAMAPTGRSRRYRTVLLDIRRPASEILADCAMGWRARLRRARRRPFAVRVGTGADLLVTLRGLDAGGLLRWRVREDLDVDLMAALQPHLADDERFLVAIADLGGRPVAALAACMLGDTGVPVLAAAGDEGDSSHALHLLQWHSICVAQERGLRYYDLGGVEGETSSGAPDFRAGLAGLRISAPGPYEARPAGWRNAVAHGAEDLYRRLARAA